VNLLKQEQMTDEFKKINPRHQVPVLVDGDFKVTDSHAIACYLANLHSDKFSLYPKDPKKRALVDQFLYMDATFVFPTWFGNAIVSQSTAH
jgi:glutathione S-transferase